jgi:uncharacterized protein YcbK (DUF882 family)
MLITYRSGFARIDPLNPERTLSFYNIHTGESLRAVYWYKGEYLETALADINHILRDHRSDEVRSIDPRLLDLHYILHRKLEARHPFHVISGYRSSRTNGLLFSEGHGVATNSLHTYGKALDIRLPDIELPSLKRAAIQMKGGGVGYYPKSDFVHLDIGRIRYW